MGRWTILFKATVFAGIVNLLTICVATTQDRSLAEMRGRISLDGCRNCKETTHHVYECFHVILEDGSLGNCDPDDCIDNQFYYARCEETATNEQDDCEMHNNPDAVKWAQYRYDRTQPAANCDETESTMTLPEEGDCQAPGFSTTIGKCFIGDCGEEDGALLHFDIRQKGRLVCGPPP